MDTKATSSIVEKSLDPQDWDEMRALGHQMVDDMMDYLQTISQQPSWKPMPLEVKEFFEERLPESGQPIAEIYRDFQHYILPYNKGNVHPRFWAWVQGTGTPLGALADFLASSLNPNVTIGEHAPMYVDRQVVNWCKQLMGFPENATGILVSGASMANITALIAARNHFDKRNIRKHGLQSIEGKLLMYCSSETHSCVQKAAEAIGLGSDGVRKVSVDADYRMNVDELEAQIKSDLAAGNLPFCVVANAGTVNTGSIDPMARIAAICKEYSLWFHVDGAFGALAKLLPEYETELAPLAEADSLAFDLHKWMYINYEVACCLIRDASAHREAFAIVPNYLMSHDRGLASGLEPVNNYGMELSRGFKALKVWMSIKEHGINTYRDLIRQNISQCQYLAELIQDSTHLELKAPVLMNIVCFRFTVSDLDTGKLNNLNKEILMHLHEQGIASPSNAVLNGEYVIRVANTNHRSTRADFEALVQACEEIGSKILKSSQIKPA